MTNIRPRVLVGSPTYSGMKYCIERFLEAIKKIEYDNFDILIVDNSDENKFFEELCKNEGIKVLRDEINEKFGIKRIVSSRNRIIEYALKGNYDYILMMDCDVIPPKEIINELLNTGKDIVSGVYLNYFMSSGEVKILPVAWMPISNEEFEKMKAQLPEIESKDEIRRHMTSEEYNSEKMFKVLFASAGCMLISRKVFENVRYGLIDMKKVYGKSNLMTTDDIYFLNEVRKKGFEVFCNTKIKCDHLISGKYKRDSEGNLVRDRFN